MTDTQKKYNRIVFILSLLGILMAIYVLQSFLRQSSIVCLTGGGCEAVQKSNVSYPFGIPVPAFGLAGYALLATFSLLRTFEDKKAYSSIILGVSIFGICFVTWFTFMEIFVIKGICSWCLLSAVNMYIVFALTMIGRRFKPSE